MACSHGVLSLLFVPLLIRVNHLIKVSDRILLCEAALLPFEINNHVVEKYFETI